jgi:hypothetical protein
VACWDTDTGSAVAQPHQRYLFTIGQFVGYAGELAPEAHADLSQLALACARSRWAREVLVDSGMTGMLYILPARPGVSAAFSRQVFGRARRVRQDLLPESPPVPVKATYLDFTAPGPGPAAVRPHGNPAAPPAVGPW